MTKTASQIDSEIRDLQAQAAKATLKKQDAALRVVDGDKKAQSELTASEGELARVNEMIERLHAARAAATRRDTSTEKAAALASLQTTATAAVRLARERSAIGAEIDATLGNLAKLIDKWSTLTSGCVTKTHEVARGHMNAAAILDPARGNGAGHALVAAFLLAERGEFAEAALLLNPTIHAPGSISVEDAAQLAADRLREGLDRVIATRTAQEEVDPAVRALHAPGTVLTFDQIKAARAE